MQSPAEILQEYWGYDSFRPLQAEIVESILSGKDTFALLPTGGGKSVCFQVPGMALDGLTLVISPLIALMRDQVEQLNRRHIPATYINSSISFREIDRKLQMAMEDRYKFLYLAPERLETEMFLARLSSLNVALVAVDEAHCISQWGYDFRPSYLRIATLRARLPKVPFAAFTATAPPEVKADIVQKLELRQPSIFSQSFRRPNLAYKIKASERISDEIISYIQQNPGAGIVYARTRKRVVAMADMLRKAGVSAAAYHGGLSTEERNKVQTEWIANKTRVVTATNAFGMGIDKPDVRFVLHLNMPADLESYYQEAGRAGRDGKECQAIAFSNEQDRQELTTWVEEKYPSWEMLQGHYEGLCNAFGISNEEPPPLAFAFDTAAVAKGMNVNPMRFHNSVRLLDQLGVVSLNERPEDFARVMICVSPDHILEYKRRFPDKAFLMDFMLRSLGGEVYSDSVPFLLANWAKKLQLSVEDLSKHLVQLAMRGLISYHAPTTSPTLRFLYPRQRLHKQVLGWDKIEFLKEQGMKRLAAVQKYLVVPASTCRSVQLETYFGEKPGSFCGVCDWCLARKPEMSPSELRAKIREDILQQVKGTKCAIQVLVDSGKGERQQRLQVIRELIDEGRLRRVDTLHVAAS